VLLLPLLVIRKRYAAAVAPLGLLGLYALAAWLVLPPSLWGDWTRNVLPTGGYGLRPFNLFLRIRPFDPPPGPRGLAAALMTVFVLNYYPVADNFAWGQINLIVLALVCFAWLALKRGGHALSIAVPLSLAILLKTYPVVLLPLLLIRKRYAAAGAVAGLLALYGLAAWLVLPAQLWGDWVRNVMPTGGTACARSASSCRSSRGITASTASCSSCRIARRLCWGCRRGF
jgi:hypothetical protein